MHTTSTPGAGSPLALKTSILKGVSSVIGKELHPGNVVQSVGYCKLAREKTTLLFSHLLRRRPFHYKLAA